MPPPDDDRLSTAGFTSSSAVDNTRSRNRAFVRFVILGRERSYFANIREAGNNTCRRRLIR
jgi:hypothetical protein